MSSELSQMLRAGQMDAALSVARSYCSAHDPYRLLAAASDRDRPALVSLLRDVLTQYPHTLLGAPVLITYRSARAEIELPVPEERDRSPSYDLDFLGWLPLSAHLPIDLPREDDPPATISIKTGCVQCAIALCRTSPDLPDAESHTLTAEWWAALFGDIPLQDTVHISSRMLLPYPDALEAARVLYGIAATGTPPIKPPGFLSDHAWAWAIDAGLQYRANSVSI